MKSPKYVETQFCDETALFTIRVSHFSQKCTTTFAGAANKIVHFCEKWDTPFTIVLVFKSLQCSSLQYDALFLALFHWIFRSSSIDLTNQVEEYHIAAEAAL